MTMCMLDIRGKLNLGTDPMATRMAGTRGDLTARSLDLMRIVAQTTQTSSKRLGRSWSIFCWSS